MQLSITLISFLIQLSVAGFFNHAAYQPDPPRQPLRRGDQVQDVLAKRAMKPVHTYTTITPSPGAKPIAITSQYQVVTSYIPQLTLCSLSGVAAPSAAPPFIPSNIPLFNSSMSSGMAMRKRQVSLANTTAVPPFPTPKEPPNASRLGQGVPLPLNNTGATTTATVSVVPIASPHSSTLITAPLGKGVPTGMPPFPMGNAIMSNGFRSDSLLTTGASAPDCTVHYSTTRTAICYTVLKGLARHHTVTDCDQLITYSSQYGYTVAIPAGVTDPATLPVDEQPYVVTQTTFYEAPWTDFTAGTGVPSSVTEKVCSSTAPTAQATCVDYRKGLQTRIETHVTRTTSHVDLTTTLPGPSKVVVETFQADITEVETIFTLKTRVVTEVSTEGVVTDSSMLATLGTAVMPEETGVGSMGAMGSPSPAPTTSTSTSTIHSTSTSTVTRTMERRE